MRIVFLKSLKDQSGYALYGNPPRWHKVSAENPAPSDAHHVALSHYHVAAVKKLKDSHHASAKSAAEMAAEAKDLGANLQAAASASAAVSGWKAAMLAGKKPTASQQAAFDALPDAKKAELLAAVGSAQATADPKDAALQAAIDHLKEDAQQDDLPAEEKAEGAALVEKLEAAVDAPAPVAAIGDVFSLDSQYEKMNAGQWVVYNVSPDGALLYMHKVGAKVPNQKNSATIPVETLQAAIAAGTATKDAPAAQDQPTDSVPDQTPIKNENPEISGVQQSGPKEGDTKQKDGKTYVLKNGRWRLQVSEQEAAEDKADLADALLSGDNAKASDLVAKLHEVEHGHEAEQPAQDTQSPVPAAQAVDTHAESAPAPDAGHQPGTDDPVIADLLAGNGSHYHVKAAQKLAKDGASFDHDAVLALAAEMQAAASLSAAFSGWKKSAAQGKNPTPAQWKAFYAQPKEKQAAALEDVTKVAGSLGHLSAPAVELPADSPKAAAQADALDPKVQEALDTLAEAYAKGDTDALNLVIEANQPGTPVHDYAAKKKAEVDAAKPAAPAVAQDDDALITGWADAIAAGQVPTKAQADAVEALDEDAKMGVFFEQYANHTEGVDLDDDSPEKIDAAQSAAQDKVHELHETALGNGPKDGDTKQGADGQLVFKDGHWHKVQQAEGSGGTTTTLHHTTDGHNKFWSVTVDGSKVTTHYGKIGTKGSVSTKDFPSEAAAATHAAKLVQQKTGKGYYPVSSVAPSAAAPKVTAAIEDSSLWHQTGPQKGSNPGGKFKDASGQEWYVKTPATEAHVKNEILAAELYKAAGVAAPDLKTVRHHGKLSVASKWVDGLSKGSASDLANNAGATSGFGVDAWLANWDAVGLEFDNLLTAGGGQAVRIDVGGSLLFRAQGEAKGADFGDKVTETKTLLDAKKNPNTAAVFCSMSKEDMEAAVGKVLAVSDEKIKELCAKHAPGTSAEKMALASKLIARKADLAKQFPGAAKAQKLAKFKPDDLSPPPNFLDWGGSGKAGPSSKSFINEANHSASQAIWAAAKTGDPEAVKSLTAPVFDKESGQVTGRVPVLSHPSQWVKGFAQQMLNEIDYQMNPPKKFRFDGGHPLAALDSAYPVAKVGAGGAAKKLGEFLVLGAPGTVDLAPEFKPDPITYKSGKLTQKTFSKAAQAAIAKLPDTQKQAIKAYTGSSYSEMNQSLWAGNQAGEAKAAAEGLHAVGHEITPGTVLSRRLKLSSIDVAQLEKAAGQILQEPAIMSTSIRPSCWTGGKNVSIKLNVGPGVKGLYVGPHSLPGGGALSKNDSEDEVILPPNTRLLVQQVTRTNKKDADGFGGYDAEIIVEVLVLPTKE